jgi:pimeloyl-ACP methyl ester carboxylesterase
VTSLSYYEISGVTAAVEWAGAGDTLLCIHSAGQSAHQWRQVLQALPAEGYRVIAPDLPGHGRSELLPAGPVRTLSAYRQWLVELMDVMNVPSAVVVGCSIGGKLALDLAANVPDRVAAVVAMAADARNRLLSVRTLELGLEDAASPSRSDRTYYGTLACIGRSVDPERAASIAARHRREDPLVSTADLIAWTEHDLRGELAQIRCPVHLVAGEDDFWVDVRDAEWAAGQIRNCTFEVLPGIGHYPMEELADFPELLAGWLSEIVIDRGSERWMTPRPSSI